MQHALELGFAALLGALEELATLRIDLGADDIARIEAAFPAEAIAGTRYLPMLMKMLDSERA